MFITAYIFWLNTLHKQRLYTGFWFCQGRKNTRGLLPWRSNETGGMSSSNLSSKTFEQGHLRLLGWFLGEALLKSDPWLLFFLITGENLNNMEKEGLKSSKSVCKAPPREIHLNDSTHKSFNYMTTIPKW